MPPPLVDPAIVVLIVTALTELLGVVKIIASSKTRGKELKERLLSVKRIIDQISKNISASPDRGNLFKDFQAVLQEGFDLVENLETVHSFDIFRRYRYGRKIRKFQREVSYFLDNQVPLYTAPEMQKLDTDISVYFQRFESEIMNALAGMDKDVLRYELTADIPVILSCDSFLPDAPPKVAVGLNDHIKDVKQILFQKDVNAVVVAGMSGIGKTTLVSALCQDSDVKDSFQNIIFMSASHFDNVNGPSKILLAMWDNLTALPRPNFRSIEDARKQLLENLELRRNPPALVVLDNVCSTSNLEPLLFEAKGYKTIITTTQDSIIPITGSTCRLYRMNLLEKTDALSLFCYWAFGQTSIPTTANQKLVKQVAAKCNGLPLALMVIGSCLRGEPPAIWQSANEKLSRAQHISESHIDDQLLNCLEIIIDILDDVQKQCFLDLAAFPKSGKFSVDLLLNIWVYVHGMEWQDALVVLFELAKRNLINLTGNIGSGAVEYSCASELFFFQHGLMRDLALRLANQDNIVNRKRLFMHRKDNNIPKEWLRTLKNQSSGAQFLSIHTGAMQEQDWCQIHFPDVEALALIFEAEQYCLPTFLHTMPKLKVLILYNYSSEYATLSGLLNFPSTVQIRSLLLNKLRVPPLYNNYPSLGALEKLDVLQCEGLGNVTLLDKEAETLNFPNIKEINIYHCSDLRELSATLCNLTSLQILSVTNCHLIQNLPENMERLRSLKELRLSTCTNLARLPPSICKLRNLEYLDISQCGSLRNLPSQFDQLSNLQTLNIRECSGLKNVYKVKLKSLKRVMISDPEVEGEWLTIPNVTVDVVVERFSLDWID